MKDVSAFLEEVAESRRSAQIAARASFVIPPDFILHPALEVALKHGFQLRPVLARSPYIACSSATEAPSCDRDQIEYWWALHRERANWFLEMGEEVVSLEIDPQLCQHSLGILAGNDFSWLNTLQFPVFGKLHLLYRAVEDLPSLESYPGLRLYTFGSILVPPSRTRKGVELAYDAPHVSLLSADWIRDAAFRR